MKRFICFFVVFCLLIMGTVPWVSAEDVTRSNADVEVKVGDKYTLEAVIRYMTEKKIPPSVTVLWKTSDAKIATVANGIVKGVSQGGVVITASAVNEGIAYQAQAKVYVVSTVTGVALSPEQLALKVGQTEKLVEKILPDNALLKTVTWKSDDMKIATVINGAVKGIAEGDTTITVTTNDGAHTAKCRVHVVSTVSGVVLKEHALTKKVGETFAIEYAVLPADAYLKDVKWTSSDPKVLSATGGKLKALSKGTATVKVETVDGKYTDECLVQVESMVEGITLNKDSIQIVKGNTEAIAAVISPADAVEKGIVWKSENIKVATVKDGLITGVEDGQTAVTATTMDGSFQAKVAVTVVSYNKKVESIDLLDAEVTMNVGENKWFLYKAYPEDAVVPKLKVTYTGLYGTKAYPVQLKNNSVYLEANLAGDYKLTLSLDSNPSISDTCILHVISMTTGIWISNGDLSLVVGEKKQLNGNALPDTAIIKGVTWKSSAPQIAKVNLTTGEVVGIAEGNCIITATTIDGALERTCNVTVTNPVDIESLKIRDENGNIIGEKPQPPETVPSEQEPIWVVIDGVPLTTDQPPIMDNNRVLAPLRAIFEGLGAVVYWNDDLQTATGIVDDKAVQITIDNPKAYVNGKETFLDVPAKIVNNRTMVPVRFIAESLGVQVDWEEGTRTVVITTK